MEVKGETQVSETTGETELSEIEPKSIGSSSSGGNTIIGKACSSRDGENDFKNREKDQVKSLEEAEQTGAAEIITISDDEILGQDDDFKGLFQAGAKQKFKNTQEKNLEIKKE